MHRLHTYVLNRLNLLKLASWSSPLGVVHVYFHVFVGYARLLCVVFIDQFLRHSHFFFRTITMTGILLWSFNDARKSGRWVCGDAFGLRLTTWNILWYLLSYFYSWTPRYLVCCDIIYFWLSWQKHHSRSSAVGRIPGCCDALKDIISVIQKTHHHR